MQLRLVKLTSRLALLTSNTIPSARYKRKNGRQLPQHKKGAKLKETLYIVASARERRRIYEEILKNLPRTALIRRTFDTIETDFHLVRLIRPDYRELCGVSAKVLLVGSLHQYDPRTSEFFAVARPRFKEIKDYSLEYVKEWFKL